MSVGYLLDEEETDPHKDIDRDIFFANTKNAYGSRGVREAREILNRATALFIGGELDEATKDVFFRAMMELYLDSKE